MVFGKKSKKGEAQESGAENALPNLPGEEGAPKGKPKKPKKEKKPKKPKEPGSGFKLPGLSKRAKEAPSVGGEEVEFSPELLRQADVIASEQPKKKFALPGIPKKDKSQKGEGKAKTKSKVPGIKKRTCFVLMIGDDGAILTFIEKGSVTRRLFAPSAEKQHIKPLMELLESNPNAPIYLLCDLIDQSYVRHTLPPVSPLSIKKLVNRRLERDFAPEDITGSIALGREKTGRKEWNFMLISLANTSGLQQWLEPVMEAPNRFLGIYLVPVESQVFINQLSLLAGASEGAKESKWKLLVSHDKVGGFRQIVLKDGQLIFTRLTQFNADTPVEVTAGNVEQEVQNTIEYLRRLNYDEDNGLDMFIIVSQEIRDSLDMRRIGATQTKIFTPYEISQLMGLPQAALSGDRFADVVISTNFALRQKLQLLLMPNYGKKLLQLHQAQLGVKALAVLGVLYILYASAMSVLSWQEYSSEASDMESEKTSAETELSRAERRFESLGSDQTEIMRISTLYRQVKQVDLTPNAFIAKFAAIKGSTIKVLEWKVTFDHVANPPTQTFELRLEVGENDNDIRTLERNARALMDRLRARFETYDIAMSELPSAKQVEETSIVIDLNAPEVQKNYEIKAGEEVITVTLTGPKPAGGAAK